MRLGGLCQRARWGDGRIEAPKQECIIDARPIEEVPRKLEAQRQKQRTAWTTALITSRITAVLGAFLACLLQK
jgi:hypothetical protein